MINLEEQKSSKIRDIKETASDAAKIMQMIGNPGVIESLNKVKDTAKTVRGIIQDLSTPEMVKNMENFRIISENMNEASTKMQSTVSELKETGVFYEASNLIKSAKGKIDSMGQDGIDGFMGQDIREMSLASKEMLLSLKDLMNEITVTVQSTKKSVTVRNAKETINDAQGLYSTALALN